MSKKEFVDAYAKATGETKKRAEELVNAFLETTEESLVKGESIQFVGWGTFEVKERAAREGRNLVAIWIFNGFFALRKSHFSCRMSN